jgi:hypothetical protein
MSERAADYQAQIGGRAGSVYDGGVRNLGNRRDARAATLMSMDEPFYLGAYWGPRRESVEACAEHLWVAPAISKVRLQWA